MSILIYGASDDLVEVEGDIREEFNPEQDERDSSGVEPLVTFLELVNVGDLILQMVDVFYEQELIATRLTDRNDFLDPAVKEKKKFEQMLDERVAIASLQERLPTLETKTTL